MVQSKTNTATLIIVIILLAVVLIGGAIAYFYFNPTNSSNGNSNTISNFEECAAAGYPIQESYPRRCRVRGITFIENIEDGDRRYVSRSPSQCEVINFRCNAGEEAFFDNTGCGCEDVLKETFYCTPEMRNVEACTAIYQPVCGWFDPDEVQCIRYPCAQTYSNFCDACGNEEVLYYTEGECPA